MNKIAIFYYKIPGTYMYTITVQDTYTYEYLHSVQAYPEFLESVLSIIKEKYPNSYYCEVKY